MTDVDKIIAECIDSALQGYVIDEIKADDIIAANRQAVINKIKGNAENGDEATLNAINNLGFKHNYSSQERQKALKQYVTNNHLNSSVNDDVKYYIQYIIDNGIVSPSGALNVAALENLKETNPQEYDQLMRMKDYIDKMGLTYLYDKSIRQPSATDLRYGITLDPATGEYNLDNFDLNYISPNHLKSWKTGSEKRKVMSDEKAKASMMKSRVDEYLKARYGVALELPNTVFSSGNQKLTKTTLIVNFTSAHRCPAWNECLVRHVCYARAGEVRYPNVKSANDKRSVMWLSAKDDPKLMDLIFQMLNSYIINYRATASYLIKNGKAPGRKLNEYINELSQKSLSDFTDVEKEAIKVEGNKRITDIRLNENGDFIGQWLLDEWNRRAGELLQIGVNTAAYTCRHLNFEGIKNIIINASKPSIANGEKARADRYFYCVSSSIYDMYYDTYSNDDDESLNNVVPLNSDGSVEIHLKELFDSKGRATGNKYYKCPCGRIASNGEKIGCYQCRLCYQRNEDKWGDGHSKVFVMVKAHGSEKDEMEARRPPFGFGKDTFAKFSALMAANNKNKKNVNLESSVNPKTVIINENAFKLITENAGEANKAINIIANNAINSVQKHIAELY